MTTLNDPDFQGEDYRQTTPEFPYPGTNRIPTGVVELRVHGVQGGTPEQNLGDPHPIKISGDDQAGVYRRREELDSGPPRTVEAYNWSSINSGKTARAFWLLLFPFAAVNFSGWLLPSGMHDPRTSEEASTPPHGVRGWLETSPWSPWRNRLVAQSCVRGMALIITAITMLGISSISVDIVGLQCGVKGACGDPWWFGWFTSLRSWEIMDGQPTRFAIVGTLVPLAALLGLWWLSRQASSYDRYGTTPADPDALGDLPRGAYVDTIRLDSIDFWQSPDTVRIQGMLHTAVAIATLAAMLAESMRVLAPESPHRTTFLLIAIGASVWLAVICFPVLMIARMRQIPPSLLRPHRAGDPPWKRPVVWLPAAVPALLLAMVVVLGWGAVGELDPETPVLEPIRNGLIIAALLGGVMIVTLAFLVGAWRVMLTVVGVGVMWYVVVATTDGTVGTGDFRIGGGAWVWLLVELLLAVGFAGLVWWRSRSATRWWWGTGSDTGDPTHRHGLLWIVGSAGLLAGIGMGADARAANGSWLAFGLAAGVVVAYWLVVLSMRARVGRANRRLDAPEKGRMRSGTTFVMAAVAMCAILAMVSSLVVWVSGALGTAVAHSGDIEVGSEQIAYPAEAGWFALAAFVGFVVLGGILAFRVATLRIFRWSGDVAEGICDQYDAAHVPSYAYSRPRCESAGKRDNQPVARHDGRNVAFAGRSRTLRLWANVIDDIDWMITAAVMATLAVLGASIVARFRADQPGGRILDAIGIATVALGFLAVATFLLVRSARDDRRVRGTIGILWEVMGFFPRRFHPLAPPCYSERTVIELRNRLIEYRRADPDGTTILLAHSQGTMLTTAALLSLNGPPPTVPAPPEARPVGSELDRLAFVTYGCMLERLFRRAWPDQLQLAHLVDLKARIELGPEGQASWSAPDEYPEPLGTARWMNFGRYTDYLGGRVFADLQPTPSPNPAHGEWDVDTRPSDDIMFQDPTRRWRFRGETADARRWLHSFNYESDTEDPRFRAHVWGWARTFGADGGDDGAESRSTRA